MKFNIYALLKDPKNQKFLLFLLFFAIIPALFSSSFIYIFQLYLPELTQPGFKSYLLFFGLTGITMSFALTPTTFIAIISGYFFGWPGLPGVIISYLAASLIGLWFGDVINKTVVGQYIANNASLKKFFDKLKEQEFLMVFFGRLSPILPFAMMNFAFSSIRPTISTYLIASLVGMFPRTLIFFVTGMQAVEIWGFVRNPNLEGFMSLVPLLLVIVSSIGIIWLLRKTYRSI
ncbi:MAG: VTT domain-containing protein [Chitinophagales bacterium]